MFFKGSLVAFILCASKLLAHEELEPLGLKAELRGDFFFDADYLLWKVHQEGLEYGTLGNPNGDVPLNGKVLRPSFEWESGFRLALGYNFYQTNNDISMRWSRFETRLSSKKSASSGEQIFTVFSDKKALSAKTSSSLALNMVDLMAGHTMESLFKHFNVKFLYGLQSFFKKGKVETYYEGIAGAPPFSINKFSDQEYRAIGPALGLEMLWPIYSGFSFFGESKAALIFGRSNLKIKENWDGVRYKEVTDVGHATRSSFLINGALGFRYDRSLGKDGLWHFGVQAGWEGMTILSQDLFMHGLTARVSLGF